MRHSRAGLSVTGAAVLVAAFMMGRVGAADPEMAGFRVSEIRFDESMGAKKPTPEVPKGWRFVGVSNGEKRNSNNLWFQAQDGTIYMLQGFTASDGDFVMQPVIAKLSAAKK